LLVGGAGQPVELDAASALSALAARHEPLDHHPDLHWVYPEEDKETISVDQVRELIDSFALTAHAGGAKVVVIEPAEAMTTAAANPLLKTLEEPSGAGYLLLLSHQPGRLAATVRSRCQHLALRPPPAAAVASWLNVPLPRVLEAQRLIGVAPLRIAAALQGHEISVFNKLESDIAAVCEDRIEPQAVAQAWTKGDVELALSWFRRRLHEELRVRAAAASASTGVTVTGGSTLHNAWRALPARTLFEQYDRAEKLLNQLGSGLNVDLALQAMLSALVVNRGRS
jgi:DNA polymerase-3 subunit delta'